jgi:hypothetical protein
MTYSCFSAEARLPSPSFLDVVGWLWVKMRGDRFAGDWSLESALRSAASAASGLREVTVNAPQLHTLSAFSVWQRTADLQP